MQASAPRLDPRWVALIAALCLLPGLGLKNPWPPDSPRFTLVALEMVSSGNWLVPVRAGELYSDKPPVFFWIQSTVLAATDSIRLSHQLPSLLASLLCLLLVYDLGRRLWTRRVGLWAAGILAVTVQFVVQSRTGQIDATLCAFTTLGLWGLLRHGLRGPDWGAYCLGWVAMGLGVITKGVGFLPVFALVPLAWAHRRGWTTPADDGPADDGPAGDASRPRGFDARWLLGPLLLLAVLAAWLVPLLITVATAADPQLTAYRDDLLFRQTVDRYADSWGHFKPPWYFVVSVIPWAWLPTSLALPWLIPAWWRRLRRRDARYLVLLGWIVLVVLFFSASAGKRGVYLLPTAPALALATAPLAAGLWRRTGLNRLAFGLVVLLGAVFTAAPFVPGLLDTPKPTVPVVPVVILAVFLIATAIIARPRRGMAALVASLCGLWTVVGLSVYPALDDERSGRRLMRTVEAAVPPGGRLALVDMREQMVLQSEVPIVHFGYNTPDAEQAAKAAAWLAQAPATSRVLVTDRELEPCFTVDTEPVDHAHRRAWHVVSAAALTGACDAVEVQPMYEYRRPPL